MSCFVLLADLEDWVRIIVVLIFFLGPLLNWLGGKAGKAKPQQPRRLPRVPPRPPGQAAPQPMGKGRQALEREIEDFLQQAQRGAKRQPDPRQAAQPAARQPLRQPQPAARPLAQRPAARAQQPASQQPPRQQPPRQQPLQPKPKPPQRTRLGDGVGQHVREHIESHPVSEHGRTLGRRVAQADEKAEQHIHEVFSHNLGQLEKSQVFEDTAEGTDADVWQQKQTESRAQSFIDLFRNPQSLRDAIVMTEILKRPPGMDE